MDSPQLALRRYGVSPGSHSHGHFQVLWGWRGTLELEIEGRGARVSSGRVAVVPPGARHDFWAGGRGDGRNGASCFVLDADEALLEPLAGRVMPAAPALSGLLHFLQAQPAGHAAWRMAAPLLLQSLAPMPQAHALAPAARQRHVDWVALEAWVVANLHLPISVAALARQVHLSPSHFATRCVEQWGVPPLRWVRHLRLAMARRLRDQGLPVSAVAERCGYRSASALTASMRKTG